MTSAEISPMLAPTGPISAGAAEQGCSNARLQSEQKRDGGPVCCAADATARLYTASGSLTGEIREAQIFVAVIGASSFTFACASWTQALPDWMNAHVRAFSPIGGAPELLVPDNTKTAIIKACFYDPAVNLTYAEMATHY